MTAPETPTLPPVAELEHVTRTYRMGANEVRALDELSFTFGRGEYWAVMGSSSGDCGDLIRRSADTSLRRRQTRRSRCCRSFGRLPSRH